MAELEETAAADDQPTLIVTPFDFSAKGSYRQRRQLLELFDKLRGMNADTMSPQDTMSLMLQLDSLVVPRLRTSDGSPVDALLDELSGDEFDQITLSLVGGGTGTTVPPATSEPSKTD